MSKKFKSQDQQENHCDRNTNIPKIQNILFVVQIKAYICLKQSLLQHDKVSLVGNPHSHRNYHGNVFGF